MIYLGRFVLLLQFVLLDIFVVHAQELFPVQIKTEGSIKLPLRFYVVAVTDNRKDTLNNGFALINKKKVNIDFTGGVKNQLQEYFNRSLPAPDTGLLPIYISIKKLVLSERVTAKGNIAKADVSIQFLRNYNDELTQLLELSTWMEQGAFKDASKLQEKNIRDIMNRMLKQFDQLLNDHSADPLLAPKIEFRVINPPDNKLLDDTIFWSPDRKLVWEDFHGIPGDEIFAAQSNCAFGQGIEPTVENGIGIFYITIRSAFLKKGSWYKKDQNSDEVLRHEQLHFDIAEWQIRKLRKTITNSRFTLNNYVDAINKLYSTAWEEYKLIQIAYDDETTHGTIVNEQEKWNQKVINGLNDLKEFE